MTEVQGFLGASPFWKPPPAEKGWCLFVIFYFYPAAWSPKGYGSDLSLPLETDNSFPPALPISDPRRSGGGIVGVSQHLLLPISARKKHYLNKGKEQIRNAVWSPPFLLLCPLGSGLDLHLDLRVHQKGWCVCFLLFPIPLQAARRAMAAAGFSYNDLKFPVSKKRRTSKHRKRRNRRDEDEIRAWGSENVNNRAITVRLHAQMIYNNNNFLSPTTPGHIRAPHSPSPLTHQTERKRRDTTKEKIQRRRQRRIQTRAGPVPPSDSRSSSS